MAICLGVIGILAAENMNTLLVVIMMVFLAVYQLTLGTYCWVYLGAVACDEGLSIGTGVIWFGVLILTVSTNKAQEDGRTYTHKGLARRTFARNWQLSDDAVVENVLDVLCKFYIELLNFILKFVPYSNV